MPRITKSLSKITNHVAREMAQQVKPSLHECEELSSDAQHACNVCQRWWPIVLRRQRGSLREVSRPAGWID